MKKSISWEYVKKKKKIYLYAGNLPTGIVGFLHYRRKDYVGLSIEKGDHRHIFHDVTKEYPLDDNSVDAFQSEDVFEHIDYDDLPKVFDEIYRVLKPGGYFRLSVPDYRCDILYERSLKNKSGDIIFDPYGGGRFLDGKVVDGGHLWFPNYEKVLYLIESSKFNKYIFYHYTKPDGDSVLNSIDYDLGYVQRTPDNDKRVKKPARAMSIVVDLFK